MSWNNILGQNRVKSILKNVLSNNRLPNAFLFYGNEGVGKDAIAIELAKVLNCTKLNENGQLSYSDLEACDECENCVKFHKLQHPNFKIVFPLPRGKNEKETDDSPLDKLSSSEIEEIKSEITLKSQNHYHRINISGAKEIRIISIREIKKLASLSITEGFYKIFLITNADDLNTEASNSFLKILEEPPEKTLFILTTSRKEGLLPTIVSRCQDLYFDDLSSEDIEKGLRLFFNLEEHRSKLISQLAGGSFSKAIKLLDDSYNEMRADVVSFLRIILSNKFKNIFEVVDKLISDKDKISIQIFLSMLLLWIRDLILLKENLKENILNIDQSDALESFISKLPDADLFSSIDYIDEAIRLIDQNVNMQIIFYNLIIQLRKKILKKTN